MTGSRNDADGPDYGVRIDADELVADLVEQAQDYADRHDETRGWYYESFDYHETHHEALYWSLEALGGLTATGKAIAVLQPESNLFRNFRNDDGSISVRDYMKWVSHQHDAAHDDSYGPYTETRQASEAESAYAKVLSTIRDEYGVGWPRFDDIGGVRECDMP